MVGLWHCFSHIKASTTSQANCDQIELRCDGGHHVFDLLRSPGATTARHPNQQVQDHRGVGL